MKKAVKILLKAVASVVLILAILLIAIRLGERLLFLPFYRNAEKQFAVPGINDGFIQQGLFFDGQQNVYLCCGYMTEGASRVYTVSSDGKMHFCELKNSDGSDYTGHTGGIVRNGEYIYITGSDGLDIFDCEDILNSDSAKLLGSFKTGSVPAYCHIEGEHLYVGSFYRPGNYETPLHERIKTPAGDSNTSVIYVFDLNNGAEYGIDSKPTSAISAPGLVQGMCFDSKGRIVLSTSYGLAASHLYAYDLDKSAVGEFETDGGTVELKYLDSASLSETVKAPPMSEEIILHDGKILIMTESASNKYIFGKFTSGRYVYGYEFK